MKAPIMKPRESLNRQALLKAGRAYGLAHGLSSLSVEKVVANAGISKRTLYNYYGTRDAFLAALITFDGEAWREWFFDAVREQADAPATRLLVFFETISLWMASSDFQGCLFAQVVCVREAFPESVVYAALEQIDYVRKFVQDNARKTGVKNPEQFAAFLMPTMLLFLSGAGNCVADNPGQLIAALARTLLQNNIPFDTL